MAVKRSLRIVLAALAVILFIDAATFRWQHKSFHSGAPPYMDKPMYGVYLVGNNLESSLAVEATTEKSCLQACQFETRCKAMSFIEEPWGGGECRLKDKVPPGTQASIAISAVKVYPW